jgi:hypothetical protein
MLLDALTGLGLGAAAAGLFLLLVATGVERLNQGLVSTLGFIALIAACLWLDGWILTAIPGFALSIAAWSVLRHRLR